MMILAPVVRGRKGEHRDVLDKLRKDGFVRARIDRKIVALDEQIAPLDKKVKHNIEAVVDRLVCGKLEPSRLNDSIESALKLGDGVMLLLL